MPFFGKCRILTPKSIGKCRILMPKSIGKCRFLMTKRIGKWRTETKGEDDFTDAIGFIWKLVTILPFSSLTEAKR